MTGFKKPPWVDSATLWYPWDNSTIDYGCVSKQKKYLMKPRSGCNGYTLNIYISKNRGCILTKNPISSETPPLNPHIVLDEFRRPFTHTLSLCAWPARGRQESVLLEYYLPRFLLLKRLRVFASLSRAQVFIPHNTTQHNGLTSFNDKREAAERRLGW